MIKSIPVFISLICVCTCLYAQNPVDSEKDGKYLTVNGSKLWVVTVGDHGDPLILIAGGPGSSHYGLRSFDSLSKHHKLIYFDAFGRGKSDTAKDVKEYSIQRDIDDVEGLRKALHLEKINLLGHSYGGVVAQGYAIQHPDHLKHLILANTLYSFIMWQKNDDNTNHEIKTNYPEVWDELMKIRESGAISSDVKHQEIYSKVPYGFLYAYNPEKFINRGKKPYPNSWNAKLYYQLVGKDGDFIVGNDIGNYDYRKHLKNLSMPILIIAGRYDRVAVPEMMIKYKTYAPQAKFVMFEKSGHNPQVEEPEAEFKLINDFLEK